MEQTRVSVVVPAKNEQDMLGQCLSALRDNGVPDMEIIVVDDGSTDDTVAVAATGGARVVPNASRPGVSGARNAGAAAARGEILVFTDADVVFPPGAIERLVACMAPRSVEGAVGVFSAQSPYQNFASRWKNQWMGYTYRRMPDRVALFFTSVAAVRAEVFHAAGGFDENYASPSVEDTAMGRTLARMGCNIRLCRDAEVVHYKKYSAAQVLGVDYRRARGLLRLLLRERSDTERQRLPAGTLSVPMIYPIGALCLCVAVVLLPVSIFLHSSLLLAFAVGFWFFAFASSAEFMASLRREQGVGVMLAGELFWLADCVALLLGACAGALGFLLGKRY